MRVDTKKIEWLLKNATQYKIAKEAGVNQSILQRLKSGKRKIGNTSIETGHRLTTYAEKLKKEKENEK